MNAPSNLVRSRTGNRVGRCAGPCAAVSIVLVLAACPPDPRAEHAAPDTPAANVQPDTAELVLATERTHYEPRDSIILRLENRSTSDIGFNLCFSTLERERNGSWERADPQLEEVCPAILHLLPPGENASHTFRFPIELEPARYRFVTQLEQTQTGARQPHLSNGFEVR